MEHEHNNTINHKSQTTYQSNHIAERLGIRHQDFCIRLLEEFSDIESLNLSQSEPAGGRPQKILLLTQKHLFSLQSLFPRNEVSKEVFNRLIDELFQPKPELTFLDTARALVSALEKNETLANQLAIAAPKVESFDKLMASDGLILPRDACKPMGLHLNTLMDYSQKCGYIFRSNKRWVATRLGIDQGLVVMKLKTYDKPPDKTRDKIRGKTRGKIQEYKQLYFTPKGVDFIWKKYGGVK